VNEEVALPTRSALYVEFILFRYSVRYSTPRPHAVPRPSVDDHYVLLYWLVKAAIVTAASGQAFAETSQAFAALVCTVTLLGDGTARCHLSRHPES
jgi:hypothetical protein